MGLFGPSDEELRRRAQVEGQQKEAARAQRERQVRLTKADIDEIHGICASVLETTPASGGLQKTGQEVVETRMTRSGLIVRGVVYANEWGLSMTEWNCYGAAQEAIREALVSLGFLVARDFGRDGVVVTGWDPQYYEGAQLTPERIDERIAELQQIRQEVVAMEGEPAGP